MKTKEQKRKEAAERDRVYNALTLDQKIALVESRGGSKSELKRLRSLREDTSER